MLALGAASGMLDVAMNAQGVTVERAYPRRIFASLHAAFSFGALAGALSGGLVAEAGVPLTAHLLATGALVGAAFAVAIRAFLPDEDAGTRPRAARPARRRGTRRAAHGATARRRGRGGAATPARCCVGARRRRVALCTLLAEGALNDWSAVYLADVHDAGPGLAAAGLAAFSVAMGVGRLAGDPLAERIGGARLAALGLLVAAAGFAGAALAPGAAGGAGRVRHARARPRGGLSALPAAGDRAAGRLGRRAIAAVTTTGYTGLPGRPAARRLHRRGRLVAGLARRGRAAVPDRGGDHGRE